MNIEDKKQQEIEKLFKARLDKARLTNDIKKRKMNNNLTINKTKNELMNKEKACYKWPVKREKLTPGFYA